MAKTLTVQGFFKQFPDDESCLEHLFKTRYGSDAACPKCGEVGKFRKLAKLPAYTCNCGHHIHPMAGTPFHRSSTPLQKWFYAMYLFTTSRHGVPAKELQRQLGVTYKCAWRMAHEIRKYMGDVDGTPTLSGTVQIDETRIGGKAHGKRGAGYDNNKTIVFGALQNDGALVTKIVKDIKGSTLIPSVEEHIERGSTIHSDELRSYKSLWTRGYIHRTVAHGRGEYVKEGAHINALEGVWSQLKRSISGTHVHVSGKHLAKYLGEFEFRYNMRKTPEFMFDRLLKAF